MSFVAFGPGSLYLTRTDLTPSTPVNIGFAQEMTLDVTFNKKELYGQNQFPLDVARSTAKTSGKMKAAKVSGVAMNNAFFGNTFVAGSLVFNYQEPHSVPASTPFTVTVTNSATFDTDLGVVYSTTGLPLQKVAAVSAIGQYSVAAGVYTFFSGDANAAVLFTYDSTAAAVGQTLQVTNQQIGFTPTFQLDYATTHLNKTYCIRVFQCISDKFVQSFKLEDYMIPEFDFSFFADASGRIWFAYLPDIG